MCVIMKARYLNRSLLAAKAKKESGTVTGVPSALTVLFVLMQENLHLWKLEGQHRLCHAGAGGDDGEVRGRAGAWGEAAAVVGGG